MSAFRSIFVHPSGLCEKESKNSFSGGTFVLHLFSFFSFRLFLLDFLFSPKIFKDLLKASTPVPSSDLLSFFLFLFLFFHFGVDVNWGLCLRSSRPSENNPRSFVIFPIPDDDGRQGGQVRT